MLSIKECADRLNLRHRQPIYNLIYKKQLLAEKDAFGCWWVHEAELERYQLRRRPFRQDSIDIRITEALERISEKLERIESLLLGQALEEPRPEPAGPSPFGVNPVEEKQL